MADKDIDGLELFGGAKWIWAADNTAKNVWTIFRSKTFKLEKLPASALCRIGVDTHYYMYVNGKLAVFMGGLNRTQKRAFYDEVDIAKYLIKGDNVIAFYAVFYGNGGKDYVTSSSAGLIFKCRELDIKSCAEDFTVYLNASYLQKEKEGYCPNGGHDIIYDARKEIDKLNQVMDTEFTSSWFEQATEYGDYGDKPWGELTKRPIPCFGFSNIVFPKRIKETDQFHGDIYSLVLPRAMHFAPYLSVAATGQGMETVTIRSDRTDCYGPFGDEHNVYSRHTAQFSAKALTNEFEALMDMSGEKIIFSMPKTVKVLNLGYREIFYDTQKIGGASFDDARVNTLLTKSENTLRNCMRYTFMDTPDRERTMWLGDASIEAEAAMLYYDDNAKALIKKSITDVFDNVVGGILFCNVTGDCHVEFPSHGLFFLSEMGMISVYERYADDSIFKEYYPVMVRYLLDGWDIGGEGVLPRQGNQRFFDGSYNIDEMLIENALYYSACKNLRHLGWLVQDNNYDEELEMRMENIKGVFTNRWDGFGYTSTGDFYDERANALAVITGIADEEKHDAIARLLNCVYTASPYMEWCIIEALCIMNRFVDAKRRALTRYSDMIDSPSSTLAENFNINGSQCQGYQSGISSVFIRRFGGVEVVNAGKTVNITPNLIAFSEVNVDIPTSSGVISCRFKRSNDYKAELFVDNGSLADVNLKIVPDMMNINKKLEERSVKLNRGKNKFLL